ncbi:MAG: hypothetical protein KDK97_24865, partial [Verrucomicrobiales bacterium]|nr:hypothetical protein [Verrucomicrobiales bacterium]
MKSRFQLSSLIAILSMLASSSDLCADDKEHRKKCDEVLASATFEDCYGGVDNALTGRWFVHFQENGGIRLGFWGG